MYIIRFIRKDQQPDEEYYYRCEKDARQHFLLFQNDDSELYERIEFVKEQGNTEEHIGEWSF